MFEYNGYGINVYGFIKIIYLDDNRFEFAYKNKKLIVKGKQLKAINLLDKSMDIKGVLEGIEIKYKGDISD